MSQSFLGEFVLIGSANRGESITLNPRTSTTFQAACAFASRVDLVSARGEVAGLKPSDTKGFVIAGFLGADEVCGLDALRKSPDSVIIPASTYDGFERTIPFTSNNFYGTELKGAVLGHQPPKFCVTNLKWGYEDDTTKCIYARLVLVVRLTGRGGSGGE